MGHGDSGSVAVAAAEAGLEQGVRPDIVGPAGTMDRSDGTNRGMNRRGSSPGGGGFPFASFAFAYSEPVERLRLD